MDLLTLVVPSYNEEAVLPTFMKEIQRVINALNDIADQSDKL